MGDTIREHSLQVTLYMNIHYRWYILYMNIHYRWYLLHMNIHYPLCMRPTTYEHFRKVILHTSIRHRWCLIAYIWTFATWWTITAEKMCPLDLAAFDMVELSLVVLFVFLLVALPCACLGLRLVLLDRGFLLMAPLEPNLLTSEVPPSCSPTTVGGADNSQFRNLDLCP